MTREEAVRIIKKCKEKGFKHTFYTLNEYHTALDIAIKALEQEPCEDVPDINVGECKECQYYINPDYTRCHECKSESEVEE